MSKQAPNTRSTEAECAGAGTPEAGEVHRQTALRAGRACYQDAYAPGAPLPKQPAGAGEVAPDAKDLVAKAQKFLADANVSSQEKLGTIDTLAKAGVTSIQVPDQDGTMRTYTIKEGSIGKKHMVHLFSNDADGKAHTVLRAYTLDDGVMHPEYDSERKNLDFNGTWWSQNMSGTAFSPKAGQQSGESASEAAAHSLPRPGASHALLPGFDMQPQPVPSPATRAAAPELPHPASPDSVPQISPIWKPFIAPRRVPDAGAVSQWSDSPSMPPAPPEPLAPPESHPVAPSLRADAQLPGSVYRPDAAISIPAGGKVPLDTNFPAIHQKNVQRAARGADVVIYGDSFTQLLGNDNHREMTSRIIGADVAALGVTLDTAAQLRSRIDNGEANFPAEHKPGVAVVMIGTNDVGKGEGIDTEKIAHDIERTAAEAHNRLPGTKVLVLGILPRAETYPNASAINSEIRDINGMVQQWVSQNSGLGFAYADPGKDFLPGGRAVAPKELMQADGWHPSLVGIELLQRGISRALKMKAGS
jgi:lysophospholipase L1-like esterase